MSTLLRHERVHVRVHVVVARTIAVEEPIQLALPRLAKPCGKRDKGTVLARLVYGHRFAIVVRHVRFCHEQVAVTPLFKGNGIVCCCPSA